ncbi:hypothetical protein GQF61_08165 [Sphingobacterium sp. DK4209]|uniref:Thiamine pyrophosphokinase n=1 Tax=Sphingobacterium zhuxiongii TaxID=2662364 RepID=A0A5Q0Q461_9SPHI|nr:MULTISPECIES: hypothetical protein [unclassified Sphingobacterium]MVZ65831.1 hypothetical protein [Sphingobacterium sp. DK4209]QGA24825.1 hypothetical protein GFH32_00110 [Sphingobacterium sp. dk4302]
MSSHHIVRENQEPALFIVDPHNISSENLGQLLEWSPTVITLAQNYEVLSSWGIKVDVLLVKGAIEFEIEEHLSVISYPESFYSVLFDYLTSKRNFTVNFVVDQFEKVNLLPYLPTFTINLISNGFKYVLLKQYEKWLPAGLILHIPDERHLQNHFTNVNLLDDNKLEVRTDGFVKMEMSNEYVLIGEAL